MLVVVIDPICLLIVLVVVLVVVVDPICLLIVLVVVVVLDPICLLIVLVLVVVVDPICLLLARTATHNGYARTINNSEIAHRENCICDVPHFDGVRRCAPFPFSTRKMFDNFRHCDYNDSIDVSWCNAA